MRTRVCITIDTEFSIGGAFADATKTPVAEQNVWCKVKGRSEGLGFMLDTFREFQVKATFFVETLQRHYFVDADPMRAIAQEIHEAGHEVELHSHPCWSLFEHADWRERARSTQGIDNYHGRSTEDSIRLLQQGIETFAAWGLPAPRAFRSGNLQHDANLYKALAHVGIPYSSNVATSVFSCGDPDYRLYSGTHERAGVLECPVLTYSDWKIGKRIHTKALSIAGTSFAEMQVLLSQAHAENVPLVVILTHPFEFVQKDDLAYRHARRNGVTQQRLRDLCAFLQTNNDRFDACGMVQAADDPVCRDERNLMLSSPIWLSIPRMGVQVAYDRLGRWALARTRIAA
ncbi:polysaccharide deacetylase family protein [Massilia varians]|uniref:polysaccharide deacetylase family protein n=1 Tax=Massilia varians TaxID=457921 RepID=UPI0025572BDC|nr:polysaccharide deacetylase family protein [Massilia varians]MDK6078663.1 polysaccharide deacetylase family protein [Massilia varians]